MTCIEGRKKSQGTYACFVCNMYGSKRRMQAGKMSTFVCTSFIYLVKYSFIFGLKEWPVEAVKPTQSQIGDPRSPMVIFTRSDGIIDHQSSPTFWREHPRHWRNVTLDDESLTVVVQHSLHGVRDLFHVDNDLPIKVNSSLDQDSSWLKLELVLERSLTSAQGRQIHEEFHD